MAVCDFFGDGSGLVYSKLDGNLVNECTSGPVGSWVGTEEYCTTPSGQGACNFYNNGPAKIEYVLTALGTANTISCWFMIPSSATDISSETVIGLELAANRIKTFIGDMTIEYQGLVSSEAPLEFDRWYMTTVVFNDNTHSFYVDGLLIDSGTVSIVTPTMFNIGNYGASGLATGRGSEGVIDEARFFTKALTDEEVLELYESHEAANKPMFGDVEVSNFMVGDTQVDKVMVGDNLLWSLT